MIPVAFDYERATSVDDAIAKLAGGGKALAGGHSIVPLMKLRLSEPGKLVDISRIPGLSGVREVHGQIEIGATTTHTDVASSETLRTLCPMIAEAAAEIGDPQVRNRGTIGGSIAHADPAADWLSALALIDAKAVVWSRAGTRPIPVADLVVSSFTTVLQPDDLIRSVRVPKLSTGARWGFYKFSQKAGEFAHAIGGVLHDPARNVFRAVIGAIETAPIVVADAAALFGGGFGADLTERLDRKSVLQRLDAKNVTDEYLRSLAAVALKRAANQACAA